MKSIALLAGAVIMTATCQKPDPVPPAIVDAAVADAGATPGTACANLASLGCPEGTNPHCIQSLTDLPSLHIDPRLDCLTNAKDKAGVRACGPVKCP